jgi:hypothetical protein
MTNQKKRINYLMVVNETAKQCHTFNKLFCEYLGDNSQPTWEDAPDWQKDSAIDGVLFHFEKDDTLPSDSHDNWMKEKIKNGWVYGPEKDPERKTHPCIVPFDQLPKEQQFKDILFKAVVDIYKLDKGS